MRALLAGLGALVTGLLLVVAAPAPAYACSCVTQSPRQFVDGADLIATATVLEVDRPGRLPLLGAGDTTTYRVRISDVYKGRAHEIVEVESASSGASCGLEGIVGGRRYVFFLQRSGDSLRGSLCGGTGNVSIATVSRLLDPVADQPVAGGPATGSGHDQRLVYAGAAGAVLLAGAVWLRRRRSSGS
ncbi:MAG: hypothetical protein AVDCRST_MAG34-1394 [uncultured Nocardioidaceae bacterium]|uniref:Gram-positive cocci surface proteins LPxTG domain-containing protein n=1 Tax=uncultured Nocardioidaceae bacterium TaxID=253824 RepID=A0A6J4L1L3_9ACTN|nr:MAG: hypothetical protein AVDCRST_MAG34-1394 [uncultured Nocardioidaceae bacterium]